MSFTSMLLRAGAAGMSGITMLAWKRMHANACDGQAVRKAGAAKREELLEHLRTPAGEALVASVAKLLVHAQREEVRAVHTT